MTTMSQAIMAHAETLPEGAVLSAKDFLHLGKRGAVDQALSRLTRRGELLRIGRGLFTRPVRTRFGECAPTAMAVVKDIARTTGERISVNGASAANLLGLSTQNPVHYVFWTSGPSRCLDLGGLPVELKHVPDWQLLAQDRKVGLVLRALVYLEKRNAGKALERLKPQLAEEEKLELLSWRRSVPTWLASELSTLAAVQ